MIRDIHPTPTAAEFRAMSDETLRLAVQNLLHLQALEHDPLLTEQIRVALTRASAEVSRRNAEADALAFFNRRFERKQRQYGGAP